MAMNYDDAFRTLLNDCPQLIIPVINETFHQNYDGTEKIVFEPNEHFINRQNGEEDRIITDTSFGIISNRIKADQDGYFRKFHLECESDEYDSTFLIRLYEYDTQIALDYNHRIVGNELIVKFPNTAVLLLRTTKNTPGEMRIRIVAPNGESISYGVPTIRIQDYTLEELFQKKLLFLLPFYLMNYDKKLERMERDETAVKSILKEYEHIRSRLDELYQAQEITLADKHIIMDMINHVAQLRCAKLDQIREGVKKIMAGTLLYSEAYELRQTGRVEGRAEGRTEGLAEGIEMEKLSGIQRAINKQNLTMDAAMDYMDIAVNDRPRYEALLKEKSAEYQANIQ